MAFPWVAVALGASTLLDAMLSNKRYPPELEAFLKQLSAKGTELLNSPGFTTEEVEALFGKGFENVRGQGKNIREQTTGAIARAGMSGTGTDIKAAQEGAWANESLVTNAIRDMVVAKKAAKQQDQALATQMAQMAIGGEASRTEKGPNLTGLASILAMTGMFDAKPSAGSGEMEDLIQLGADLAGTQGYGKLLGGYTPTQPVSWSSILGGNTGIPWNPPTPTRPTPLLSW